MSNMWACSLLLCFSVDAGRLRLASPSLHQLDAADAHIPAGRRAKPTDTGRLWLWLFLHSFERSRLGPLGAPCLLGPAVGVKLPSFGITYISLMADSWRREFFFLITGRNSDQYFSNKDCWCSSVLWIPWQQKQQQLNTFLFASLSSWGANLDKLEPIIHRWTPNTVDFCLFSFKSSVDGIFELQRRWQVNNMITTHGTTVLYTFDVSKGNTFK